MADNVLFWKASESPREVLAHAMKQKLGKAAI
jgi:hypothetical protein